MASGLRVELLGSFRLSHNGQPVAGVHSRQQALLARLILNRDRPLPRARLAALFWPDSGDSQALTNLRRELHNLRRALPAADGLLLIEPASVGWRDGPPSCDVCDFEAAIERGGLKALKDAVGLYQGELLPECGGEWIVPAREQLRRKYAGALKSLIALLEEQRAYAEAIEHARHLLSVEPLDEDTCRTLIRLHALKGERAAALHVYHAFARTLERELGVEPDLETRAAYQRLLGVEVPSNTPVTQVTAHPFVGRQEEWAHLLAVWRGAARGRAQMVLIRGEAGIGKTRLAEQVFEWCAQQGITAARTRSYAAEGGLAYAPVTDWLRSGALKAAWASLEAPWLAEVSRLLPELSVERPDLPPPEPIRESWQRQRLFESLAHTVLSVCHPGLLLLDDLQWCDQDTLEWLHYLLRAHPQARVLFVATLRTEEAADNPGLPAFLSNLASMERLIEVDLGPLGAAETTALAASLVGRSLEPQAAAHLFRQTEGHPLFVIEMARAGLDGPPLLSPKVQAVIAARLARLSPAARELVRLAATVGRDFSFDILREASDLEEKTLVGALDELWQRRIVREHGGLVYDFSHDRIREVAYVEISPPARRLLHRRVAQALELLHSTDLDKVSGQVAAHHEYAGQTGKAVQFYERAAEVSRGVFANEEAIRHFRKALALLRTLPESLERGHEELRLQLALSTPLFAARGWTIPELEVTLERARVLAERLADPEAAILSLSRLYGVHIVRANMRRALTVAEEVLRLAAGRTPLIPASHLNIAGVLIKLGQLQRSHFHFEQAIGLYDARHTRSLLYGLDVRVFSAAWDAHVLWLMGYHDRAVQHGQDAIAWAESLGDPYSLAIAHAYAALTHMFRGESEASLRHTETATELCTRYGFAYYGDWHIILQGWWLGETSPEEGVATIRRGMANLQAIGAEVRRPYYLSLLAQLLARAGQVDEARGVLDAALATAAEKNELWWTPELYRLRGELSDSPDTFLARALTLARDQSSRSLELRAAMSLTRLWAARGDPQRAYPLLREVYEGFTEGLDTRDLAEARALLGDANGLRTPKP